MGRDQMERVYPWILVLSAWLVYFFVNNPPCYGTNVISARLITQYGWDESVAGLSLSVHYAAIGLAAVPVGWMIQKIGERRTILLGTLFAVGCYFVLLRTNTEGAYELMFFLLGVSVSACASVSCPSLINAWFRKNKALPMALLFTAGGIGGFIFPLLSERLTAGDVRTAWAVYLAMSAASALLALLVIRDRTGSGAEETAGEGASAVPAGVTLGQAARTFRFYCLGVMIFTARGIFSGYLSYSVLYTLESGVSLETATRILSLSSAIGMAGRVLAFFIGRLPLRLQTQAVIDFALLATGPVTLVFARETGMFVLAAFFIGFGFGFENTLFPLLVSYFFGDRYFSMIYGVYNLMGSAGATAAPMIILGLRGLIGEFMPGFLTMFVLGLFSTVLAWGVFRQEKRSYPAASSSTT